jgi:hemerythrin-like domain-containing protein
MEEKVLFPALLRAAPQEGPLHNMLLEHGEERALVAAIETALNPKKGMAFVRSSRRLKESSR